MTAERAARVNDGVAHSHINKMMVVGAVAGVVVAAIVVAFGGGSAAIAATMATLGTIGSFLGITGTGLASTVATARYIFAVAMETSAIVASFTPSATAMTGKIATGFPSVHIGPEQWQAARVTSLVDCDDEPIIFGVDKIYIGDQLATRVGEGTRCKGKVGSGCESVIYGGPSVQVGNERFSGEVSPAVSIALALYNLPSSFRDIRDAFRHWKSKSSAAQWVLELDDKQLLEVPLDLLEKGQAILEAHETEHKVESEKEKKEEARAKGEEYHEEHKEEEGESVDVGDFKDAATTIFELWKTFP